TAKVTPTRKARPRVIRSQLGNSLHARMPTRDTYAAPTTDDRRLWDLWLSGVHQPAIVAAEQAGIFSALAGAPATATEVALRLGFDERATRILLRLLAGLRLLLLREGRYHLGDDARTYLVKG